MVKTRPPDWIVFPLFGLLYVAAGKLGLSLAFLNASASAVWPPAGLALAALLLFGYRLWPMVFLGALIVNVTTAGTLLTSLIIAGGNTLEAVLGAWLVQRFAGGKNAFDRAPNVCRFAGLAAAPGAVVSALIGVTCLACAGFVHWERYGSVWLTWWTGDFVSDLVIAPLILIFWPRPTTKPPAEPSLWEAIFLSVLLVLVSVLIFGPWRMLDGRSYALAYLATPLLIWAAYRFQQPGAIVAVCIMAIVAVAGTLHGSGPFAEGTRNNSLLLLQSFMGINALTALLLAAVVAEQRQDRIDKDLSLERERAARLDAQHANRTKDEFLAILSHELRTPLAPVLLTASLLEADPDLPAQWREDIQTIRRNVELEARLIEDLLDVNRIAHGKFSLDKRITDAHLALRRAVDICCANRTGDLILDLGATHHFVHGDPARLQQVFWNLLNNAVKFTPIGRHITVRTSSAAAQMLRITVCDEGIGIDPATLPRLFNAFEQADTPGARQFGGLGLGLAITKSLVEAHGGTISASSPGRDRGAQFTIDLTTVDSAGQADARAPVPPAPAAALRVLLVEDHESTRRVMARLLHARGHHVLAVGTVNEALAAAAQNSIDLIISDIGLPDGTGYDLMRRLRERVAQNGRTLKGIAVSGYGMNEDLQQSRAAGFAAHLTKPIDLERLEIAIQQAIVC